jgi:hypothetical protein
VKEPKSVQVMRRRYVRLAAELAKLGLILQGTVLECRPVVKGSPGHIKKTRGPYYQWTRKIKGKTVTVALSASQAKVFQKAIANQRKLERITRQMRQLSLEILQATTQGVKRRKPGT